MPRRDAQAGSILERLDRGRPKKRPLLVAQSMLQRAIDCGFPRERMLPYLAETAYLRRDFARVRKLLAEMDSRAATPTLSAVLDFWKPRGPGAAQPRSI